ncbi:hypothetical protein [Kitasatospora sp. NPDC086791]|uniref:hypothetical protein n=1 Tax=Kitasatospora sp. NPDC086791 TaxID=3155178 RepID=UPI00342A391F
MTSAYQQQLAQQLRAAEDELAKWRRQGRRADRYRAAWHNARMRANSARSDYEYTVDLARRDIGYVDRLAEAQKIRAEVAEAHLTATAKALASAHQAITRDPRDWASDRRDAWLYALLVGWNDALDEVAARHGWSADDVTQIQAYRESITATAALNEAIAALLAELAATAPDPQIFTGLDFLFNAAAQSTEAQP